MPVWERSAIVAGAIALTLLLAAVIDRAMSRRDLDPATKTRYRVLRRSVSTAVVAIGVLSALLVIPQVRAIAGGVLASSAVVAVVLGFAARSTLANFIAGMLIAFTQPLRLGDYISVDGALGIVEEIGLTYTFVRTDDNDRLVIPNEKLASDTIRNATIVDREKLVEVTLLVPLTQDLAAVVALLQSTFAAERGRVVELKGLGDQAELVVRARVADAGLAEHLSSQLRLQAHAALREAGVYA